MLLLPWEADIKATLLSCFRCPDGRVLLNISVGHNLPWKPVIGTLVGTQRIRMVMDPWWAAVCSGQRFGVTLYFGFVRPYKTLGNSVMRPRYMTNRKYLIWPAPHVSSRKGPARIRDRCEQWGPRRIDVVMGLCLSISPVSLGEILLVGIVLLVDSAVPLSTPRGA